MGGSAGHLAVERIGFIGTGIMGKPMAGNLLKAGYKVAVHRGFSMLFGN